MTLLRRGTSPSPFLVISWFWALGYYSVASDGAASTPTNNAYETFLYIRDLQFLNQPIDVRAMSDNQNFALGEANRFDDEHGIKQYFARFDFQRK